MASLRTSSPGEGDQVSQFAEVVLHQLMLLRLRLTRGAVLVTGMDISYSSNYP